MNYFSKQNYLFFDNYTNIHIDIYQFIMLVNVFKQLKHSPFLKVNILLNIYYFGLCFEKKDYFCMI